VRRRSRALLPGRRAGGTPAAPAGESGAVPLRRSDVREGRLRAGETPALPEGDPGYAARNEILADSLRRVPTRSRV